MSTLFVDTIEENTSGNGVVIADQITGAGVAGTVLQTHVHTFTTTITTTSTSFIDCTDSTFSFTPKLATSKLFVSTITSFQNFHATTGNVGLSIRTLHDGTTLHAGLTGGYNTYEDAFSNFYGQLAYNYPLINASNTSARNIKMQVRSYSGSSYARINAGGSETSITVMEIAQ